jgi:hypothetical protein
MRYTDDLMTALAFRHLDQCEERIEREDPLRQSLERYPGEHEALLVVEQHLRGLVLN